MIYTKGYGSARQLSSGDHQEESTFRSVGNICRDMNNTTIEADIQTERMKRLPITTVMGVQRKQKRLEDERPKLVNPFLDEDLLKQHTLIKKRQTDLDSSDNYWLHVTKDIGCKTVSQQQLHSMDATTQTIKGKKCKVM